MMARSQSQMWQIMTNTRCKIPQKHIDIDFKKSDDEFYDSSDNNTDPVDEDGN